MSTIRVGIGGWVFEPWRETFFPKGLAKTKELAHASRQVTTIEVNATYYRGQTPSTFRKWAGETPDDFVFSLKASRYACNRKDLADGEESIRRFVETGITELGPKLGPILWQLAPTKKFAPAEIDGFLALLPKEIDGHPLRHVIEPRHASFQCAEFVEMARARGVTICLAVHDDYPLIADPSGDVAYLRLQTTRAEEESGYDAATIAAWAARARALAGGGAPDGLAVFGAAEKRPSRDCFVRDCFVYVIGGAKERNPAAAQAMLAALRA